MRLLKKEVDLLKNKLQLLCNDAKLYLFGSRVDDTKKGGDIDLLIISKNLTKKDLRLIRIMKDIRNTIAHEYIEDDLAEVFEEVLKYSKTLQDIINNTLMYISRLT
ncbi:MAG: hypothetical protein COB17_09505 [Sulfurimonas sp.]|nr:MAG: hypothetical protein COB17_09505 [Sulfurimonas sp.]